MNTEEVKMMNSNEASIEELIEQLTKVRPSMLNKEALKLFNTIMAVLDERDKLIKENKELKAKLDEINNINFPTVY